MADDPVSAELAAIREDLALMDSAWPGPPPMRAILGQHAPRLLAAVEAALGAHHDSGGRCAWCRNPDGSRQKWPCGEYLTITRALAGEESSDASA